MDEFERDAVFGEIERLGRAMRQLSGPPQYYDAASQPAAGADLLIRTTAGDGDAGTLTEADIRGAKVELADRHGVGFVQVEDMIQRATVRSGIGRSELEQAAVIQQVMLTLQRGRGEVDESGILELSQYGQDDALALAGDDGGQDDGGTGTLELAQTQETAARKARKGGQDDSASIIARHPEFAHLFKPGRTSKGRHPARSGREVTSKTRAHAGDLEDSPQDHDQPARGGDVHSEVDRYLKMREEEFGGESRRKATGPGNKRTPAKGPGTREREEHAARDSHRLDITDLHPGPGERGEFRA